MYLLIKGGGMLVGIFTNKKIMRMTVEAMIKSNYQKNGYHGHYHFRYIKVNANDPWLTKNDEDRKKVSKAIFSFSTMHSEYFPNEIETDWNTGKILKF